MIAARRAVVFGRGRTGHSSLSRSNSSSSTAPRLPGAGQRRREGGGREAAGTARGRMTAAALGWDAALAASINDGVNRIIDSCSIVCRSEDRRSKSFNVRQPSGRIGDRLVVDGDMVLGYLGTRGLGYVPYLMPHLPGKTGNNNNPIQRSRQNNTRRIAGKSNDNLVIFFLSHLPPCSLPFLRRDIPGAIDVLLLSASSLLTAKRFFRRHHTIHPLPLPTGYTRTSARFSPPSSSSPVRGPLPLFLACGAVFDIIRILFLFSFPSACQHPAAILLPPANSGESIQACHHPATPYSPPPRVSNSRRNRSTRYLPLPPPFSSSAATLSSMTSSCSPTHHAGNDGLVTPQGRATQ